MTPNYAKVVAPMVKIVAQSEDMKKQAEQMTNMVKFSLYNNERIAEAFNNNIQRELCLIVKEILRGESSEDIISEPIEK